MRVRRILRIVAVAAGIAVVLLVLATVLLHTRTAKRLAFERIQTILAKSGLSIEAADFNYSFRPLRVSTGRISIQAISTPGLPRLFSADHFEAGIGFSDLIRGRYHIEDLRIDNPEIHIVIDEQQRNNLPARGSTGATSPPLDFLILKLRSTGGSFKFEDRSRRVLVDLPAWDLAIDGDRSTGTNEIQLTTSRPGEARYMEKTVAIQNTSVQATLNQRSQTLRLHGARMSSDLGDIALDGTVSNFSDPALDLSAAGNVHIEPARQFLSITQNVLGDLRIEGSVKGRPRELQIAGRLMGSGLADRFKEVSLDTDFDVDLRTRRARLTSIRLRSPIMAASGTADLAIAADAGESRVDGSLDIEDLRRLSALYKLPVSIASRVTGSARGRWPGLDLGKLDGTARIQLFARQTALAGPDIPVAGVVNLNAQGDRLRASIDSADSGALHLTGQLNIQGLKRLNGSMRIDASDSGQALTQIVGWTGSSWPTNLHLSGPAGVDAVLAGTLDHPQIRANMAASGLRLNDLKNIDVSASAEYIPERLNVQQFAVRWESESLTGSARIGLKTPSPTLEGQAAVSNASVRRVLAALGRTDIPADGNVAMDLTLSGTVQNATVKAKVSASDLQAYGEPFGTLSAEATLQGQTVRLDTLSLSKAGGGELQASGRYEIPSGSYVIDLNGRELHLDRVVLPQGNAISGSVDIEAQGRGTLENPGGVVKLRARDFQVDSEKMGSIDLDANLVDHQARITAGAPFYGVMANAAINVARPYSAEVEVHIDDADISRIPVEKLKELSGRVTANVKASGNLLDFRNAAVLADVPSLNLDWRHHAITNDGTIELRYANRELTISQANIRMDGSTARFSGNVPMEGSNGQVKVEGRANLAELTTLIPFKTPVRAQGELVLNGTLRGNLKRIEPDLTIAITNGSFDSDSIPAPLQEANLKAVARDGRVILEEFTGRWSGATIAAKGEATFALLPDLPFEVPRPISPVRLSVNVEKFTLSSMTKPPPNTDGTISLKIEAEAPNADINTAQVKVTFPDLTFNVGNFSLEQAGESSIEIRDGIASVQKFELTGTKTNIHLSGTADLRNSGPVDVKLSGDTDAAVLALFTQTVRGTGAIRLNVDVSGTARQPTVNGFVEIEDVQAQIDTPRIAAENVHMRLDLKGNEIDVTRLEGTLNGGDFKGQGRLNLFGAQRGEARIAISGDGIYLEFPPDIKTVSNAQLRIDGVYPNLILSGNVDIVEGAYTDPLLLGRGLMKYLIADQSYTTVTDNSMALKDTRLDVVLRTLSPVAVNNNVARGDITAELRLLGTIGRPGLTGKVDIEEGARLNLRERKYSVDRGIITFNNERAIEPILDVIATTTVSAFNDKDRTSTSYDITMKISGEANRKVDTELTSSPPLDQKDIVSVLATGRTTQEATAAGGDVAKEQVLSYLAGNLGTSLTSEAGRAIGLSQVQIEPNLIANEEDPTARLTLGKDITPKLSLIYSMNLRDSSDQTWIVDYNVTRRFSTSGLRQNDNTYRFQLQHDLLFGLPGASTRTPSRIPKKIGKIEFSGATQLTAEQLSSAVRLKSGSSYDFFSVQSARERLEKALSDRNRLESRISVERKMAGPTVDLVFRIKEGPQVQLIFNGWDLSGDLKDDVRKAWIDGVIDAQRIADAVEIIESGLIKERYFGFHLDSVVEMPDKDLKRVRFEIQPGRKYGELQIEFEGNRAIAESELQKLVKDGEFFDHGPKEREQAVPTIENAYKERGYIDVKVEPPRNQLDEKSGTAKAVFRVTEGGLYHFGNIEFQGNAEFTSGELSRRISIGPNAVFRLETSSKAQQTLQELYRKTGYNDAAILYSHTKKVSARTVDLTFQIQEGLQRIVKEIQVEGTQNTSRGLVRSQMALETGDILSDEKLSQARKNLNAAGSYAFVEIEVIPLEASADLKPNQTAVRLITRVREIQPWQLKYGGFYDTERGLGVITDLSNRNMLGNARTVGVQVRYDSELREGRLYFSQPVLRRFPVKALFTTFLSHEKHTDDQTGRETITKKKGLVPTFEYRFRTHNTVTLGYKLESTHEFSVVPDPLFPEVLAKTAPLTSSFTRDTRDDPFDATSGNFTSHAVDWGTGTLGSDLHYLKYFGQYFKYRRFGKPTTVPWAKNVRNRVVMTWGARVGLLNGEAGQNFRTEQFKTGGGTTVRGFGEDRLGPLDAEGNPTGGDAVLILNSEFRFPTYKFIDGVAFVDAGNVYPRLQDFSPFDVRASYGFGLRVRTPYLLLRFDYGINMKPKPQEPRAKFIISIGQAF